MGKLTQTTCRRKNTRQYQLTSNTQSVIDELSMGTRMAKPFSLPFNSGKIVAIAVADPVEVGARLSIPARQRRRSWGYVFSTQGTGSVWRHTGVSGCRQQLLPHVLHHAGNLFVCESGRRNRKDRVTRNTQYGPTISPDNR